MSLYSLILVLSQFNLIFLIIWKAELLPWNPASITTQLIGICIALWGVMNINIRNFNIQPEVKSEVLVSNGIFKFIRNPMYTGIILFFLPVIINNHTFYLWVCFFLLFMVFLLKIYREETFLLKKFGEEYSEYKKNTWRLLPFIY